MSNPASLPNAPVSSGTQQNQSTSWIGTIFTPLRLTANIVCTPLRWTANIVSGVYNIASLGYNFSKFGYNIASQGPRNWANNLATDAMSSQTTEMPQIVRQNVSSLPLPVQATASLIAKKLADPILQCGGNGVEEGFDINPLHWTPENAPASSLPAAAVSPSSIPPAPPLSAPSVPNPSTDTLEMDRYATETKLEARKKLYPILQVFSQAQILLSNLKDVSPQIIDDCIKESVKRFIKTNADGTIESDFQISVFREILKTKGINLTTFQKISMSWTRFKLYFLGVFNRLISSSIDMLLSKAYFQLFGENGKKQTQTLREMTDSLSSFFRKYLILSKNFRKDKTYLATGNTEKDFISEMIRTEQFLSAKNGKKLNEQELFSLFSIEKLREFIGNSLKFHYGITENTTWFHPKKLWFNICYAFAWLITCFLKDTIAENTAKLINSTIKNIIDPNTQFTIKKNTIALLKEFKAELQKTDPKPASSAPINFQASKDPIVHENIRKLAIKASELLKLELPDLKIEKNTPLEKILQMLPNNYGETIIAEIFNSAVQSVIPGALLSGFEKLLHPSNIHESMKNVIKNTAEALSSPNVKVTKEQEDALNHELETTLDGLSEAILRNVIRDQITKQLDSAKSSYGKGFEPPRLNIEKDLIKINFRITEINEALKSYKAAQARRYRVVRLISRTPLRITALQAELITLEKNKADLEKLKSKKYDVDELILHSLRPRLSNLLNRAINLIGNENFIRGMIYQVMAQVV
jgi:hypothetical protein